MRKSEHTHRPRGQRRDGRGKAAQDAHEAQQISPEALAFNRPQTENAAPAPEPAHSPLRQKLLTYWRLTRMHRPIGIFLLLWPVLWSLWIAGHGAPRVGVVVVFVLGTVLMRAAGCVINDYADRNFDPYVSRTQDRPLARREIAPEEALRFFAVLVAIAGFLVLTMNRLTIYLAFVAVPLAIVYPFMKRYTYLPQVYLGAAFGWGVPMSFAAQTNALPPVAWLLLASVVLWVLVYDTEYAMVDREDDLEIGVKSTAILFDDADRLIIGLLQVLLLVDFVLVGREANLHWPYYAGVAGAGLLCLHQQYLIREREPAACFRAFLANNWLGATLFVALVADYLLYA
jgi:4-hydroxybenzoate polyprenyltransferase